LIGGYVTFGKQTAPQPMTNTDTKQEDVESHSHAFHGIKAAIAITLAFFWIPLVVIYLALGWWYVVAYIIVMILAVASISLGRLRFHLNNSSSSGTRGIFFKRVFSSKI
jgi:uncharacterized membrane protein YdbT with pleckstrin-like domain